MLNVFKLSNRRYFINGGCRLGSRCKYRHERPVSMQPCRYFQKGGCWYGESCRWASRCLHSIPSCKRGWRWTIASLPPSGIAMFPSLKVQQLQVEDVLHLLSLRLSLPPVLTGEGRNLLSCRLKWCQGKNVADHLPFMSQILKMTSGKE